MSIDSYLDEKLATPKTSAIDTYLDSKLEPKVIQRQPQRGEMKEIVKMADDFEQPVSTISDNYDMLVEDPSDVDATANKWNTVPQWEKTNRTIPQAIKNWFVPEGQNYLPPDAGRAEKAARMVKTIATVPMRTSLEFAKGMTFGSADLAWAIIKNVTPQDMWDEEVKDMNLTEAMDWAMGYDPSGFAKLAGDVGGFMGRLRTAKGITRKGLGAIPKGAGVLTKAADTAIQWGIASTGQQATTGLAEAVDEAEYGYAGPKGVVRDMALGFVFSVASQGVAKGWQALKPTERMRALKILKLKEGASESQIRRAAQEVAKRTHPDKVDGFTDRFKQVIEARDVALKGLDIVRPGQVKPAVKPPTRLLPGDALKGIIAKDIEKEVSIQRKFLTTADVPELIQRASELEQKVADLAIHKGKDTALGKAFEKANKELIGLKLDLELASELNAEEILDDITPEQPAGGKMPTEDDIDNSFQMSKFTTDVVKSAFGKIKHGADKFHDWLFTFGEAKRTDRALFDQLMKGFGKRNTGIETATRQVEAMIPEKGLSQDQAVRITKAIEDKSVAVDVDIFPTFKKFGEGFQAIKDNLVWEGSIKESAKIRMFKEVDAAIDEELLKLRSESGQKPDSEKLQNLEAQLEAIKNMRELPDDAVTQQIVSSKISELDPAERLQFLKDYSEIETPNLTGLLDAGLIEAEDMDVRKIYADALADYYKRSTMKSLYDYADKTGLMEEPTEALKAEGWIEGREAGINAPELRDKLLHPLFSKSLAELNAMQTRKGGPLRTMLGMIKTGQFIKPQVIGIYNAMQKTMRGMWSVNPKVEGKAWVRAFKDVQKETPMYRLLSQDNLYQFPYEVSKASMDEQVEMMVRKTMADKGMMDKVVEQFEKLTDTSFKRKGVLPKHAVRKVLLAGFRALGNVTWYMDKIQRTQSYHILRDMGYRHKEAVQIAANSHGAYSALSKDFKEKASLAAFVYAFRVLMPIEMGKTIVEPVKYAIDQAVLGPEPFIVDKPEGKGRGVNPEINRMTKAIIGTVIMPVAIDTYMKARGFEVEGKHLGPLAWKYKKTVTDPDTGKKEDIVVSINNILNTPIKAWNRITDYNPLKKESRMHQSMKSLAKWELHPLWRTFIFDVANNKKSFGGLEVYNTEAEPLEQAGQIASYVFGQSFRIWELGRDEVGTGQMTTKEKRHRDKVFSEGLTKMDRIVANTLGHAYTTKTLEQRKGMMAQSLAREVASRRNSIARKYEGEELKERIDGLKRWAKKAENYIKNEME